VTVGELLDNLEADYRLREIKSLRHSLGHIKPVREHFGLMRALSVTTDKIRTYIAARQKLGRKNAKVNRETEVLGRAFRLAAEDGKLSYTPKVPRLPEINTREGFFERTEFEAVVAKLADPLDDLARFAYLTGWRRSEVTGLRWETVDRADRELRIYDSKNGDGRVIPLAGSLWELIEKRWAAREFANKQGDSALSPWVFHRMGKPIGNFAREWRSACKEAKLPGKLFHDLRRTAVRDTIRSGTPQAVAMTISGHRIVSVFQRYNITSAEDKIEALRRRESYLEKRDKKGEVIAIRKGDADKDTDKPEE
jgi:integrase